MFQTVQISLSDILTALKETAASAEVELFVCACHSACKHGDVNGFEWILIKLCRVGNCVQMWLPSTEIIKVNVMIYWSKTDKNAP